jgi:thiol-disulfide isomerase/thioredoxin
MRGFRLIPTTLAIVMLSFAVGSAAAREAGAKEAAQPSQPSMTVEEAQRIVDAQPASAQAFDAIQVLLQASRVTPQNRGSWEQTTNAQVHRRLARLLVEHHLARPNFTEAAYLPYFHDPGETIAYWQAIYAGAAQHQMRGGAAVQIMRKSIAQSNQSNVSDEERQRLRETAQRYLRIINEEYADDRGMVEFAQQSAKALAYSVGAQLPSVEVPTLAGGMDSLARYRGKVVVVEFWATWCPWCRHAFPQLAKLKEEMRGRPFEVIGISVDDTREQVAAYLKDKPELSWTQWFAGPESPLVKDWGVVGYPTLLLVDANGVVRERTNEPHARLQEHVRRLVSQAEQPIPAAAATAQLPPVSIADTLAFREIVQVQMKPDGSAVAFVARKPIVGTRENEDTLMLVSSAGGDPRSLLAGGSMELKSWDDSGRWLYALRRQGSGTQVVRIDSHSGESRALWQAPQVVESLAISPDGRWCVAATRVARESSAEQKADQGMVFEYGLHTFAGLLLRSSTQWIDLFTIDTTSGAARRVARLPYEGLDNRARNYVEGITIAPDNLKAALVLSRIGEPARGGAPSNVDVAIVDLRDGRVVEPAPGSIYPELAATWLGGSQRLFFFSNGEAQIYTLQSASRQRLPWAKLRSPFDAPFTGRYERRSDSVSFAQTQSMGRVEFKTKRMTSEAGILDEASYAADGASYAFVSQAADVRPAVAVREVKTGATRRLVDLNTYLDGRALGRVEKLTVTNAFGAESVGFLIYPADYRAGQRYPLLLASYGFRGQFSLTAEWHTSFPAQALAGRRLRRTAAEYTLRHPERAGAERRSAEGT